MSDFLNVKLMTYNIGGGRKNFGSHFDAVIEIIRQESPDILAIQESTEWATLDGTDVSQTKLIADAGKYKFSFFGPTLDMRENFHVHKKLLVYGVFNDWKSWKIGNALLSRWPFVRLGNDSNPGEPENIPIFRTLYQGNRDTDPRFVILAKVDLGFTKAYTLTTHLTTFYGERGAREIPKKSEEAQIVRWKQCELIIDLIREFVLERNELVFFMGDFNALPSEPALANTLTNKGGFVHLKPQNKISSHLKLDYPVDHIYIFPGRYHIKYTCAIFDDGFQASDHNPVIANLKIYEEGSKPFMESGPGVFKENIA